MSHRWRPRAEAHTVHNLLRERVWQAIVRTTAPDEVVFAVSVIYDSRAVSDVRIAPGPTRCPSRKVITHPLFTELFSTILLPAIAARDIVLHIFQACVAHVTQPGSNVVRTEMPSQRVRRLSSCRILVTDPCRTGCSIAGCIVTVAGVLAPLLGRISLRRLDRNPVPR